MICATFPVYTSLFSVFANLNIDFWLIQVCSNGCIFVWKVPGSLSARMLRKIKENACPLSPAKFPAPVTSGQIKLHEINYHQPEGISMTPNLFQVKQRVLCREGSTPATSFKFSISRLPKWAQAKVTNLPSLMTDPNSSFSEVSPDLVVKLLIACYNSSSIDNFWDHFLLHQSFRYVWERIEP